ncbi:MAG: orotidine-5'-phosphate decarboxylase [Gammaproteobacteria bacterium]|nr:orotidine-5'-phosphate decarboxylase [Gammaproteobacteria bacterium]MCB1817344.1 orotidine-5'-phosphate decarboxylase [Gammaproteobacteria bacterium]MCP5316748.1 orotidine-5'-phosphate decarboxylase [Chromatiaceae bacterium]MCP5436076.1 orotidine-5'-phosphate decarboxylase [Chromatiaceae bacterium]HOP15007.1 orotidine-5'-phosphate decarboxylase [Gammaproteobacteria bacterium]
MNANDPRVIVALDYPAVSPAMDLLDRLDPAQCRVKIGKEMFTRAGPAFVEQVASKGFEIFLDLKYHDIPNTVAAACAAAADMGVWMMNVHASGGRKMMTAAAERVATLRDRPLLIAVTILTSLGQEDIAEIGYGGTPADNVRRLAALAEDSGLDGVVCSPLEVSPLRNDRAASFLLVTPGVRPAGAATDDQKRVMTPGDAIRAGASYLVVGRPITGAPDPLASLAVINAEVEQALA